MSILQEARTTTRGLGLIKLQHASILYLYLQCFSCVRDDETATTAHCPDPSRMTYGFSLFVTIAIPQARTFLASTRPFTFLISWLFPLLPLLSSSLQVLLSLSVSFCNSLVGHKLDSSNYREISPNSYLSILLAETHGPPLAYFIPLSWRNHSGRASKRRATEGEIKTTPTILQLMPYAQSQGL